jgi:nitrate reductase delta subunit
MKTFRILGMLMSYPQPAWLQHLDECSVVLREENLLPARTLRVVMAFIDTLQAADPYCLQEDYVATFDRGRAHALHLFEHIHGESRDRGQAMVNLAEAYAEKGLVIDQAELPDYLPLFLEFLSCCAADEAVELLGEPVDVIATIGARLRKKGSQYAALFEALVALSKVRPRRERVSEMLAAVPEEDSLEALDKEWEEAGAFARPSGQPDCRGCAFRNDGLHSKANQAGSI